MYLRYKGELYSALCGLTEGDAKSVVRTVVEKGFAQDGFKAFVDLGRRFEHQTPASLLQTFTEGVNPPHIKSTGDVIPSIHRWEAKLAVLKNRHGEDVTGNLKMAFFSWDAPQGVPRYDHAAERNAERRVVRKLARSYHQRGEPEKPVETAVGYGTGECSP